MVRSDSPQVEKKIPTLDALEAEAVSFVQSLTPKSEGASLVTLTGDLGAGKTAFTKAVARALGVEGVVNSPTFVLEKVYALEGKAFKRLIHIDAYRLTNAHDLVPLGFDELMKDRENLIMLEWPERVREGLPPASVAIALQMEVNGSRTLTYA